MQVERQKVRLAEWEPPRLQLTWQVVPSAAFVTLDGISLPSGSQFLETCGSNSLRCNVLSDRMRWGVGCVVGLTHSRQFPSVSVLFMHLFIQAEAMVLGTRN